MIKNPSIKSGYEKLKVFLENKSNRAITVLWRINHFNVICQIYLYKDLLVIIY